MSINSSATAQKGHALSSGIFWGFLGVTAFSLTVPLTRVAVQSLPATFVGIGRIAGAGILALAMLLVTRQPFPPRRYSISIGVIAAGVVFGFPLLTSFALQHVPSSHAAIVISLLPVTTAVVTVLRTQESPQPRFWVFALLSAVAALSFVITSNGLHPSFKSADFLLFAAVLAAAIGYAEGGVLAKTLGSWQTISWALVFSLPASISVSIMNWPSDISQLRPAPALSFTYLTLVSMYLGFFAWYRGLALGPMVRVSQIQLIQPVLTLIWSWILLKESISLVSLITGALVMATALATIFARSN